MYIFLSVLIVCITFIWFCNKYLQPYQKPQKKGELDPDNDKLNEDIPQNLDKVIAELYDYLDEEA